MFKQLSLLRKDLLKVGQALIDCNTFLRNWKEEYKIWACITVRGTQLFIRPIFFYFYWMEFFIVSLRPILFIAYSHPEEFRQFLERYCKWITVETMSFFSLYSRKRRIFFADWMRRIIKTPATTLNYTLYVCVVVVPSTVVQYITI